METYTPFCCLGRRLPFISSYKYTIRFQDLCHASLSNVFSNRTFRHHPSPFPPSNFPLFRFVQFFEFQRPLLFRPLSPFNLVPRDTFSFERVYKSSSAFSFHKSSQQSRRLYSNFSCRGQGGKKRRGRGGDKMGKEQEGKVSFNSLIITVFIMIFCSSI